MKLLQQNVTISPEHFSIYANVLRKFGWRMTLCRDYELWKRSQPMQTATVDEVVIALGELVQRIEDKRQLHGTRKLKRAVYQVNGISNMIEKDDGNYVALPRRKYGEFVVTKEAIVEVLNENKKPMTMYEISAKLYTKPEFQQHFPSIEYLIHAVKYRLLIEFIRQEKAICSVYVLFVVFFCV